MYKKCGPYKPRTGCTDHTGRTSQCMNHTPAILAVPALIYSTHRGLVVWITVAHFHLCSLLGTLSRYTVLEVWAVLRLVHVHCGSRCGRCVLFTNILDILTTPARSVKTLHRPHRPYRPVYRDHNTTPAILPSCSGRLCEPYSPAQCDKLAMELSL